jgi:hypothetical protein
MNNNQQLYDEAVAHMKSKQYFEAIEKFLSIANYNTYSNVPQLLTYCKYKTDKEFSRLEQEVRIFYNDKHRRNLEKLLENFSSLWTKFVLCMAMWVFLGAVFGAVVQYLHYVFAAFFGLLTLIAPPIGLFFYIKRLNSMLDRYININSSVQKFEKHRKDMKKSRLQEYKTQSNAELERTLRRQRRIAKMKPQYNMYYSTHFPIPYKVNPTQTMNPSPRKWRAWSGPLNGFALLVFASFFAIFAIATVEENIMAFDIRILVLVIVIIAVVISLKRSKAKYIQHLIAVEMVDELERELKRRTP